MLHWSDDYWNDRVAGPGSSLTDLMNPFTKIPAKSVINLPGAPKPKDWTKVAPAKDWDKLPPSDGKQNSVPLDQTISIYNELKAAYENNGITGDALEWNMVQDWMESGAFSNAGYKKYNNPGNIMWPKKGKLKYGKRGGYNAINNTYYVSFPNLNDYVKEKIAVLSQNPGKPINATDLNDFVHRLKLNNYFGKQSEDSYLAAMKGAAQRIRIVASLFIDTHQKVVMPDKKEKKGLKWWQWGLIGLGGVVVLKKVLE